MLKFASITLLLAVPLLGCVPHRAALQTSQVPYPAVMQAADRWAVAFDVDGTLTERLVEQGATVIAGQPLARLRVDEFEVRARDTQTALRDAIEKTETTRTQLTAQDLRVFSPSVTVPTEPVELRERALQVVVRTAKADSEARQAEWARDATLLRAPRSGKIVRWVAQPIHAIRAGETIVELEDDTHLRVVAMVPNAVARGVRVGQRATVMSDEPVSESRRNYDAMVRSMVAQADDKGHVHVVLEIVEVALLKNGANVIVHLR